jgi:hypothetical protein
VLEVSILAFVLLTVVKPSSTARGTLFLSFKVPGAVDVSLITFQSIIRSAEICGFLGSKAQPTDKASFYVFTALFLGVSDDVTSHLISESCTYATLDRSAAEIFSIFIFKM